MIEDKKDDPSKTLVFRGRNFAKMKFEIREELEREIPKLRARILKATKLQKGKKTGGKKTLRPIISKEIRNQYADMVLKGIDRQAVTLSRKISEEMVAQRDRVLAKVADVMKSIAEEPAGSEKALAFYKEKEIKVTSVFDKAAENKVVAEFVFPYLKEFADAAGADALGALNPANDYNSSKRLYDRIRKHAEKLAEDINNTTVDGLEGIISEGIASGAGVREISVSIAEKYNEFDTFRSERIARTETTMANNEGLLEAYKQSDVATHKEWIATMDDRTRDTHAVADGEMVPVDQPFTNGLMYPGDPGADPAETINCRCVIAPAFEE
jgi:SPP1 gp7 family putative phage head morphogenesis protein